MQTIYDFLDDMDAADGATMKCMRREMLRMSARRSRGPGKKRGNHDRDEDYEDYDDYEDDDDDYDGYEEDEFDEYTREYRD